MKSQKIIKIVMGALALLIIIAIIWGIGANNRIDKLQEDYNISVGKNIVYEQNAQRLKDSISKINTSYILLQKTTDSLTKIHKQQVAERDAIISKYRKEHQIINNLSDIKSIEYFNSKIASTSPVIITSITPDTTFSVPGADIKKANDIFVENDELKETNSNLKDSEKSLLSINSSLKLEINNRQSANDKLTELVSVRDKQNQEKDEQIEALQKINKKENRKDTLQKIGIGAAGVIATILALTL